MTDLPATPNDDHADYARDPDDIGGSLQLGDDSDCETCGRSCNHIEWNLMDDEIRLVTSTGCYGSETLDTTDLDEAADFIVRIAAPFSVSGAEVVAAIAEMRDLVTAYRARTQAAASA